MALKSWTMRDLFFENNKFTLTIELVEDIEHEFIFFCFLIILSFFIF